MSNAYYQSYGTQNPPYYGPQPSYNYQQQGFAPTRFEYTQQPASAPTASAPEPQVILIHQRTTTSDPHCCCRYFCECLNGLVTGLCRIIFALFLLAILIGVIVYFAKFYNNHS